MKNSQRDQKRGREMIDRAIEERNNNSLIEHAIMNGGDGLHSYTRNSSHQRSIIDAAKLQIQRAVFEKLELENITELATFYVADLGCSTGPNTFIAVQNILEAVKLKHKTYGDNTKIPEFQVFFNDHSGNDFNTLFKGLPTNREYYASGVPGSFYFRLFPRASLHFVHSSYSLQWLSQVPKEVIDKNSPAWNRGRIYYSCAKEEVVEAYARQHASDMACFLRARAEEVVPGGLVAILIPSRLNGVPHASLVYNTWLDVLGSCLMELSNKGSFHEYKVDSFNLPMYIPSAQELEKVIEQNGCFNIESLEYLPTVLKPENPPSPQYVTSTVRAAGEELIKKHFGAEILDELFDLFLKKLAETRTHQDSSHSMFVLLKKKIQTSSSLR